MQEQRNRLPIAQYRQHIIESLEQSQVLVLSGETGWCALHANTERRDVNNMVIAESPPNYRPSYWRIIFPEVNMRRSSVPNHEGYPLSLSHSVCRANSATRPVLSVRRTRWLVTPFGWKARSIATQCSLMSPMVSR